MCDLCDYDLNESVVEAVKKIESETDRDKVVHFIVALQQRMHVYEDKCRFYSGIIADLVHQLGGTATTPPAHKIMETVNGVRMNPTDTQIIFTADYCVPTSSAIN